MGARKQVYGCSTPCAPGTRTSESARSTGAGGVTAATRRSSRVESETGLHAGPTPHKNEWGVGDVCRG
jgi:hypothetical protein